MAEQANLNAVASANRIHIGFFGCRNAGKSSVVNALTNQELSVVSDIRGTTTDPVSKAMELKPLGPVVIIDTPGFDDVGELGEKRVRRTKQILNRTDAAVLVADAEAGLKEEDLLLLSIFREKEIPHVIVWNKTDLTEGKSDSLPDDIAGKAPVVETSVLTGEGIDTLLKVLGGILPVEDPSHTVTEHVVKSGDTAVLVCPIDTAAPKGRLIMPQQMTIRGILDIGAAAFVTRETELEETLHALKSLPDIVITDSQAFGCVAGIVPDEVPLTSFSILMAKYKGFFETSVRAAGSMQYLKDGDRILMAEGCTHHRQCGDIGTVKIPAWLRGYSNAELIFDTCSGMEFPEDLSSYRMVIHCGGCMLNEREVRYRMKCAVDQGVPFINYGIAIAQMKGILERSIRVFPAIHDLL